MGYSPAPNGYSPQRSPSVELVDPPVYTTEILNLAAPHRDVRQWIRKVESNNATANRAASVGSNAHIRANTVPALAKVFLAVLAHGARRTRGAPMTAFQLPEDVEVCREADVTAFTGIDCLLQV